MQNRFDLASRLSHFALRPDSLTSSTAKMTIGTAILSTEFAKLVHGTTKSSRRNHFDLRTHLIQLLDEPKSLHTHTHNVMQHRFRYLRMKPPPNGKRLRRDNVSHFIVFLDIISQISVDFLKNTPPCYEEYPSSFGRRPKKWKM